MTKIRSGSKYRGLPGFKRSANMAATGAAVSKNTSGKFGGVSRVFAQDPADGDTANIGTAKDVPTLGAIVKPAINATLTTALAGANNDLKFTAKIGGVYGNGITVAYVVSGTSTALSVAVVTKAITVTVATNGGGTATSTAAQVKAAIDAFAAAAALVVTALASGNDGTGVVTALSATNLAGGVDAVTPKFTDTNTVGTPSPSVSKSPNFIKKNAEPNGTQHVVNKGTNRRFRITKN